jgi:hypothetical protein
MFGEQRDRHQVLDRIVGEIVVDADIDRHGRAGGEQDGMAIRRRLCDKAGADGGAGARPVVDHERLAQPLLQPPPEQPGHGFGPAAWRIGDHEQDGSRGIFLRGKRRRQERRRDGERQGAQPHRFLGLFRVCRGLGKG